MARSNPGPLNHRIRAVPTVSTLFFHECFYYGSCKLCWESNSLSLASMVESVKEQIDRQLLSRVKYSTITLILALLNDLVAEPGMCPFLLITFDLYFFKIRYSSIG